MSERLTAAERAALQIWTEHGNGPERRRARIILLHDEGLSTAAIAAQVGLSQRQVRRWLAGFRDVRMGVFARGIAGVDRVAEERMARDDAPFDSAAVTGTADVGQTEPEPAAPMTIGELCARNGVDMNRAHYVRDLALQLFDLTADVHQLSSVRRSLLEAAATLHNVGAARDRARRHLVGRDLILAQPVAGLERSEHDMLAAIVAFHRKQVRQRREKAFERLPGDLQQETLALAALLRMAVGLDSSNTQSSAISRIEVQGKRRFVIVEGIASQKDASAAQRGSDLWRQSFKVRLNFMTEEQLAQAAMMIKFGMEPIALPELDSPGLVPDDAMSEAGRKTLWFHFLRMLKHEPGTSAGKDIEELHDMRVATRRMRAAVRVFGDFFEPEVIREFNRGIRRVTRALGPVRDLDVFEEKAGQYLKTLPEQAQRGLDPLIETWHAGRETAREKMLAFLDGERYHRFKSDFAQFLQTEGAGARPIAAGDPVPYQVRHVAPRLIYTRYEAVRAYETVLNDAQIETLHALRIDCKYLRYTLEFLREVLGPEGEAVISEVKAMQDHLGDLNDAEVAIGLLSEFLGGWDASQTDVPLSQRRSGEGIVTYLASRHAEKHRLLTTFPEAWARLNRQEVRRWMALAVATL